MLKLAEQLRSGPAKKGYGGEVMVLNCSTDSQW